MDVTHEESRDGRQADCAPSLQRYRGRLKDDAELGLELIGGIGLLQRVEELAEKTA